MIAGSSPLAPGVAPAVSLLSIRVADDQGFSDTFTLAQGIIAAADAGASVLNISLSGYGDSPVLRDAVAYAIAKGAVIVASAGNDALQQVAYPAAYPGVLAVGAVDANGDSLAFSNRGDSLAATAPGFEVNAAWPGDLLVQFSGTSASAPILAGAIAATMATGNGPNLTANQAAQVVLANLDEAGYPGPDSVYGQGLVDMGRVIRRDETNVVDAAIASQVVLPPETGRPYPEFLVTVQNRGTSLLVNSAVEVTTPFGQYPLNVTTLAAGATQTFRVALPVNTFSSSETVPIQSVVSVHGNTADSFPSNNTRNDQLAPANAP